MKPSTSRTIKSTLLAVVILLALTLKDLLIEIAGGKVGDYLQAKFGISTTILIYALISVLLISFLLVIYDSLKNRYGKEEPERLTENVEPDFKKFFDSLKKRYQSRYEQKLAGRFEITLEVSKEWSDRTPRVIKEKFGRDATVGEAVEVINQAFTETGGLLIVGDPGAGKTVLLLKLAMSLLDKVDLAKREAFPVIFNLASWSPEYERLEDWLIVALESGYGLSRDSAATLLHQKRIIFLLDGLDELARNEDERLAAQTRGAFLQTLNLYLAHGKKVVISCRRDELALIKKLDGQDVPVAAKATLLGLTEGQIKNALRDAIDRADAKGDKIDAISAAHLLEFHEAGRSKALLDVLRTPFYFTTALEVFGKPIPDDEQIPDDADDLKRYLLDKLVETKLYPRHDRKNFKPEKMKRWLNWLGLELKLTRQVNFELSSLQPGSLRHPWMFELLHGAVSVLGLWLCFGRVYGLIFGLYVVFKVIDMSYLGLGKESYIQTEDIRRVKVDNLSSLRKLKRGLVYGLVWGSAACLIFSLRDVSVRSLVASLALGLFIGVREVVWEVSHFVKVETPYQRLKAGFIEKGVVFALVCLTVNTLSLSVTGNELVLDNKTLLFFSLCGGASIGFSLTPLFRHFVLRVCLYIEGAMPLKYATFLDYAMEARILEKDGGQWRFRHQHLQAYFSDTPGARFKRVAEEL